MGEDLSKDTSTLADAERQQVVARRVHAQRLVGKFLPRLVAKQDEKGDLEEAFYGMSLSGDPTPQPTGNVRRDAMIQARLARESHGTKEQRMNNFRSGLDGGAKVCLEELHDVK